MIKYKIYASLLDAYTWYKKSEKPEAKQELIDKINRVEFKNAKTDKGKAFNELVDEWKDNHALIPDGTGTISYKGFSFNIGIVKQFIVELEGASQVRVEAEIETSFGTALLYGDVDELLADNCIDIKTSGSYEFPFFLSHWQHIIYPYCLNRMGVECNMFTYLITDFTNIFKEDYKYNEAMYLNRLTGTLEDLIFFLEMNRDSITDKKVFAMENVMISEYDFENDLIFIQ